MLEQKELTYEVITPLYLGGADPRARDDARIYVRPIVAQWRWWFRALAGGVFGTTEGGLAQVRRLEQHYFGGVHAVGEAEAGPMRFRVRLKRENLKRPSEFTANRDPVINYLGYGLASTRQQPVARLGIPPGSKFTLEVVAPEEVWKLLCVLNYFWANFGGLGARHRRGLGSIEWLNSGANSQPQNAGGMLNRFRELVARDAPRPLFGEIPEMPVVHPDWFRAKLSTKTFSGWKDALAAIRNQLRIEASTSGRPSLHLGEGGFGYRQGDGRSHSWVQEFKRFPDGRTFPYYPTRDKQAAWDLYRALSRNQDPTNSVEILNARFGLPLVFGGWHLTITAYQGDNEIRRPSPLSFRVFRMGNQYRVAVVYFKSRFLPENSELRAVCGSLQQTIQLGAGWEYLDRFFELCEGTEVRL